MAKRTTNAPQPLAAGKQVAELQRLRQQAVAWLAECSDRTVRAGKFIGAKNDDGTYDARRLVRELASRVERPKLSDDETETVYRIADAVFSDLGPGAEPAAIRELDRLCRTHGDAVLLMLTDRLIDLLRDRATTAEILAEFDEEEVREELERRRAAHAERVAADNLDVAVVCQHCGKIRLGTRWTKGPKPRHSVYGICPGCVWPNKDAQ